MGEVGWNNDEACTGIAGMAEGMHGMVPWTDRVDKGQGHGQGMRVAQACTDNNAGMYGIVQPWMKVQGYMGGTAHCG